MRQTAWGQFDRVTRALVAGAAGGLVGAGVKLLGELIFPPRSPGEPIPPAVAVSKLLTWLTGHPLLEERTTLAVQAFHWSFSLAVGALYGLSAEFWPRARIARGAGFGVVLLLATHESLLPLTGLSLPWSQIPLKEHASELLTHVLFGVSVELVRGAVRERVFGAPTAA